MDNYVLVCIHSVSCVELHIKSRTYTQSVFLFQETFFYFSYIQLKEFLLSVQLLRLSIVYSIWIIVVFFQNTESYVVSVFLSLFDIMLYIFVKYLLPTYHCFTCTLLQFVQLKRSRTMVCSDKHQSYILIYMCTFTQVVLF